MKKSVIASLLMLILVSPLINAITFKRYTGERSFYLPNYSSDMGETIYEKHSYEIDFPADDSSSLNTLILKEVFGKNSTTLNDAIETFLNTFIDENSDERPQLVNNSSDGMWVQEKIVRGNLKYQSSDLIVYEDIWYEYIAGSARGMSAVSYINYYEPLERDLTIFDLLLVSKKALINKAIRRNAHTVSDILYSSNVINNIGYSETFYLSEKGITFVYPPYEIGPYITDITVPKSHLAGCLTPLGKKLIK